MANSIGEAANAFLAILFNLPPAVYYFIYLVLAFSIIAFIIKIVMR